MATNTKFGPEFIAGLKSFSEGFDRPLCLRDLRRLTQRMEDKKEVANRCGVADASRFACEQAGFAQNPHNWPEAADLDRAINKLGPRWPLSLMGELAETESESASDQAERELGEDRQKDTDEVAEASDDPSEDADVHGGDGNSGEVDAPAETESEDPQEGESDGVEEGTKGNQPEGGESDGENGGDTGSGAGITEESEGETAGDSPEGGNAEGENGGESGDGMDGIGGDTESDCTEASGQRDSDHESDSGSPWPTFSLDPDASEVENFLRFLEYIEAVVVRSQEVSVEEALADDVELNADITPFGSKGSHGGINCRLEDLEAKGGDCDPRDVADIKLQIEKIFCSLDDIAGAEQSPRISGQKLVVELVSKRVNLAKARREELQPGVKLLMCDVSGSCSAVCQETLAACAAVAKADPQVVIVVHSNGYPEEVYGDAAAGMALREGPQRVLEWWESLMDHCRIIGTINWGDWDAGEILCQLADQAPLVWLDSYCARDGAKLASRNLRSGAARWPTQPKSWWQGVNNAASTAFALRQATRAMRK